MPLQDPPTPEPPHSFAALLRRRGAPAVALAAIVAAAVGATELLAAVTGAEGRGLALAVAAVLALVLGGPLVWCLRRGAAGNGPQAAPAAGSTGEVLAGAETRERFVAAAEREWARAGRYGQTVGLALIEIDRFHQVGERFGAEAAQAALAELSRQAALTLRGTDLLARVGESRFAVLLPQADSTGTVDVAERIRERGALLQVGVLGGVVRVTVSLGVALLRPAQHPLALLLEDAEAALQAARLAGGNCVRSAPARALRLASKGPSVGDNHKARGDG